MNFRDAVLGTAVLTILNVPTYAQPAGAPPSYPPLRVILIRDNVYWAPGGVGGNSGVIVGKDGVTVIDAKETPDTARELLAKIAEITPKPVKRIVLTGAGGEDIPGLPGFPDGLTIISHAIVKHALEVRVQNKNPSAPPLNRMPNQIVSGDRQLLTLDGIRMIMLHLAPSHSESDCAIYLPDERVVFTGYVLQPMPDFPIIHPDGGGSALGWVKFVKALILLDADSYVLGDGAVWTKAQMQQRLDAQEAVLQKIRDLIAAGKTREEVRQAMGSYHALDKYPGMEKYRLKYGWPPNFLFSEVAYDEVVKERAAK